MKFCLPMNITIVEKRTRSIIPLIQSTVIIEIRENILFTPTRFCDEFSYFFLQLPIVFFLFTMVIEKLM